ncbi:MAG: epoxide hydrolase, partial [Haliea sp.]|nr:epoxide hydrolase [Haliea sp.]
YWESFNNPSMEPITIPTGCSIFPHEIFRSSRRWAEQRFHQLIHWNELPKGGHFAALEQPATLIDEVRNCFRSLR